MLPYTANEVVGAVLREQYGPEEATRRLRAAVWTNAINAGDSIFFRAAGHAKRLATRIAAFAF